MENSLTQLDRAIEARLAKENEFLRQITAEFERISTGLQQTASANPQVQADLQRYIQRIDEAVDKLNTRPSFGARSDINALVQNVTGRRPPPPPPGSGSGGFLSGLFGSSSSSSSSAPPSLSSAPSSSPPSLSSLSPPRTGASSSLSDPSYARLRSGYYDRPPPLGADDYQEATRGLTEFRPGVPLSSYVQGRLPPSRSSSVSSVGSDPLGGGKRKRGGWKPQRSTRRSTQRSRRTKPF